MMNFSDLLLCLLTGFAIPLALSGFVADGLRSAPVGAVADRRVRVIAQWTAAMICGPGLFAGRLVDGWRSGDESLGEQLAGWLASCGWAVLYGYVVLSAVRMLFSIH